MSDVATDGPAGGRASYWEGKELDAALETRATELRSEADRTELYARLFAIIDRNAEGDFSEACRQLQAAIQEEAEEDPLEVSGRPATSIRMASVLASLEERLRARPKLLVWFFSETSSDWPEVAVEEIKTWLTHLESSGDELPVSKVALLALRIYYGAYGTTWREAGDRLTTAIDHDDLTVRACAAYRIGMFCKVPDPDALYFLGPDEIEAQHAATEGMLPIASYWDWIRQKEIARPGVAGAFCSGAEMWKISLSGVELRETEQYEWLLTLLEQALPEPYIPYFPVNLGFLAHEWYSRDPDAIRRLMNAGQFDIALAAACEERYTAVEGMLPILLELGERDDPEDVRLASWTLAYLYNTLHPKGARLGYVQRYTDRKDGDLYLLYSKRTDSENPYAAVLYPKPGQRYWTMLEAQALVNRLFPKAVRGPKAEDDESDVYEDWRQGYAGRYERGYVDFHTVRDWPLARAIDRITIGYRADPPWNPLEE